MPAPTRPSSTCTASRPILAASRPRWSSADLNVIVAVRREIAIPLAVKLSPYYSAMANFATACRRGWGGRARALQPLLSTRSRPRHARCRAPSSSATNGSCASRCAGSPSGPRLPDVSLAATFGITEGTDVVKALDGGRRCRDDDVALLRRGPGHVTTLEAGAPHLDGGTRLRLCRPAMRQRELCHVRQSVSLRARQLHEDPPLLDRAREVVAPRSKASMLSSRPGAAAAMALSQLRSSLRTSASPCDHHRIASPFHRGHPVVREPPESWTPGQQLRHAAVGQVHIHGGDVRPLRG